MSVAAEQVEGGWSGGRGSGPVFVSTEFQGRGSSRVRCRAPAAFGWATGFGPSRRRSPSGTARSCPPRSRPGCWRWCGSRPVDHQEAGGAMRARGQGVLTLVLVGRVAVRAVSLRPTRPEGARAAPRRLGPSGLWLCPHGGGPGRRPPCTSRIPARPRSSARLTAPGRGASASVRGRRRARRVARSGVEAPRSRAGASRYVEYFGGWVAAGWVVRGAEGEAGIGAEPCTPRPADRGSPRGSAPLRVRQRS